MSEQEGHDQRSDMKHSEPAQGRIDGGDPHDSDDEPMVYETLHDYATSARQTRDRLIAKGADPDSVIFESELHNHIPRREGESPADSSKRYNETINAMRGRGVVLLNDECTADVRASGFNTADGRFFDLGPGSGVTKGEFRQFSQWFSKIAKVGQTYEVPEKWSRFEKSDEGKFES